MDDLLAYSILASGVLGLVLAIAGLRGIFLARRPRVRAVCRVLAISGSIYTLLFILYTIVIHSTYS